MQNSYCDHRNFDSVNRALSHLDHCIFMFQTEDMPVILLDTLHPAVLMVDADCPHSKSWDVQ